MEPYNGHTNAHNINVMRGGPEKMGPVPHPVAIIKLCIMVAVSFPPA